MKKTFFFAIAAMTIGVVGCKKEEEKPTPAPAPVVPTLVDATIQSVAGTWQLSEKEDNTGKKLSTSADATDKAIYECAKKSVMAFSASGTVKGTEYIYDTDTKQCDKEENIVSFVIENGNLYSTLTGGKDLIGKAQILGDKLILSNGAGKSYYTKISNDQPEAIKPANVTITARLNGVNASEVSVAYTDEAPKSGRTHQVAEFTSGNSVKIDVRRYIGKKLYFYIKQKNSNDSYVISSAEVEKTIAVGENSVELNVVKTEIGVKISVTKDGRPSVGEEVYALSVTDQVSFDVIKKAVYYAYNATQLKEMFKNSKKVTTDANGVASFGKLETLTIAGEFAPRTFVVLGATKYYTTEVRVDNLSVKTGTIAYTTTAVTTPPSNPTNPGNQTNPSNPTKPTNPAQKVSVFFYLQNTEGGGLRFPGATIEFNGVTQKFDEHAPMVFFDNLPDNQSFAYTFRIPSCNKVIRGTHNTANARANITLETPTVELKNTSSNPYTVNVNGFDYVMEGNSTKTLPIFFATTEVKYKQNSGYMIYPTEGKKNVTPDCNFKATLSFP